MLDGGAKPRTRAHELGHAAGLEDIYWTAGQVMMGPDPVQEAWESRDWNSGPGPWYYASGLQQRNMILRLVMHGWEDVYHPTEADIPLGKVYGLTSEGNGGLRAVGLDDMDRMLHHW